MKPTAPTSPDVPAPLTRARNVALLLDDLLPIPGTSWRVGLDPLLGLVPGLGDWVGWAASLNLLFSAGQLGASPWLLIRMLGNVALDAAVGALPFLGDLFDAGWKANSRNLALLEAHVANPERTRAASKWLVGGVLAAATGLVAASTWSAVWVLRQVLGALGGLLG
jgi:hypothetical protein